MTKNSILEELMSCHEKLIDIESWMEKSEYFTVADYLNELIIYLSNIQNEDFVKKYKILMTSPKRKRLYLSFYDTTECLDDLKPYVKGLENLCNRQQKFMTTFGQGMGDDIFNISEKDTLQNAYIESMLRLKI